MLIGLALAPALPAPSTPGDAETGMRVPMRTLDHLPRPAHERPWHCACVATPPLPHALADPASRAAHRFMCTHSETDRAVAKLVRP
jgi:hypothetical protein